MLTFILSYVLVDARNDIINKSLGGILILFCWKIDLRRLSGNMIIYAQLKVKTHCLSHCGFRKFLLAELQVRTYVLVYD